MNAFRQKKFTRLSKAVVIFLGALLLQTLGAAMLHVTLDEHTYCESHQAFEHSDASTDADHARATSETPAAPEDDSEPGEHSCDVLTWLQGPSVPLPVVHASMLDLPPPAEADTTAPLARQAPIPSPIDILRLAPAHSPPVVATG